MWFRQLAINVLYEKDENVLELLVDDGCDVEQVLHVDLVTLDLKQLL